MSLYSEPPPLYSWRDAKPTLLVCWWITMFCTVIILLRVSGRWVRTERLFPEDKVAALAIIPLWARMGCVQVILTYGTNNAQFSGADLTPEQIRQKSIASGLVLLSRILYAATLWIFKNAVLEFFKRLTGLTWERSYHITLIIIRVSLAATFVAVIISDLAECHPFTHYWQVLPDPGGQCRQGYAQLITMATCNIITDLMLIIFPVPIILRSHMGAKRKFQLVLLFSLGFAIIGVTLYRVPQIIWRQGSQTYRSLLASVELLFATVSANALVLGSFVRDRGVKKKKFKYGAYPGDGGSVNRSNGSQTRRPTHRRQWGSDEDLVRGLGLGVEPSLRERPYSRDGGKGASAAKVSQDMDQWNFPKKSRPQSGAESDDLLLDQEMAMPASTNDSATPGGSRKVSFFDVGGLLSEEEQAANRRQDKSLPRMNPLSMHTMPSATHNAPATGYRRGSTALLQDLGGMLGGSALAGSALGGSALGASALRGPVLGGSALATPQPATTGFDDTGFWDRPPAPIQPSDMTPYPGDLDAQSGPQLLDEGGLLGSNRRSRS